MVKAIIFDCFGVLVRGTLQNFQRDYLQDPDLIAEADELDYLTNVGKITYDEFISRMAVLAKLPETKVRKILDDTPADKELLHYIETSLKPKYKVGLLSNAGDNWLDELFAPGQIGLFDDVVLSYDVKMAKPDPKIFELAAQRLGVDTAECVFIDDIQRYCDGAREAGMQAILYHDFETFKNDLKSILM